MVEGLVSIVIPIYKSEKYLDECIRSIVEQSYRNLEIWLVDDGSPDASPRICDEWAQKDSRIHVIHKKNAGSGMARNTGMENATGEYICFFDSDDYLLPDAIEKMYHKAKEEQVDIVIFGVKTIDSEKNVVKTKVPLSKATRYDGADVQNVFLPDLIDCKHVAAKTKSLCLSFWECMFSMDLVRRTNWKIISERDIISEDSYSLIWLYRYVKSVAFLPEVLYCYRLAENSLSHIYMEDRHEKNKTCYYACQELAEKWGYSEEVHRSICALHLSLMISAIKQIVTSKKLTGEGLRILKEIINDDTLQSCLRQMRCRRYGWKRRVLFWAMRNRYVLVVYLVSRMQTLKDYK